MKKVLIITYYWPPSGGSGVQRWVKFAKYLPQNGWQPVIYTPENPELTVVDGTLEDDVPEEVKVRRLQEMIDLQNKLSEESNLRDIGKVFEVLIEGYSKRSREQLFGRTSQNKVVIFDKKNFHVGQFIRVKIQRASSATLFGEPVEE